MISYESKTIKILYIKRKSYRIKLKPINKCKYNKVRKYSLWYFLFHDFMFFIFPEAEPKSNSLIGSAVGG